jgi:KDEL-tailed cysteine endopeptidase
MSRTLQQSSSSLQERHEQWMTKYDKVYKDDVEKEKRFMIFKNNVEYIESFNAANNKPYKLSVNHLADLTLEEFKASRNGYKKRSLEFTTTSFKYENVTAIPPAIDWRVKGAVTPIKDQGQCGKTNNSKQHHIHEYFIILFFCFNNPIFKKRVILL